MKEDLELPPHARHWQIGETYITKKHRIDVKQRQEHEGGYVSLVWHETPLNADEQQFTQSMNDSDIQSFNVPTEEVEKDAKKSFLDVMKGWFKK